MPHDRQVIITTLVGLSLAALFVGAAVPVWYTNVEVENYFVESLVNLQQKLDNASPPQWVVGLAGVVPSLASALSLKKNGNLTRFGWFAVGLLGTTLILGGWAAIQIEPHTASVGTPALATSLKTMSTVTMGYAATILTGISGLKIFGTSQNE